MSKDSLKDRLGDLVEPIVSELGFDLYHLEFVKEGKENYLRVYIDKEDGNISLDDCEKVSRAVSDMLDLEDPIKDSYYLEVSSPGIERTLYTEEHLKRYIGSDVSIKLYSVFDGKKQYDGKLIDFDKENIVVDCTGSNISIPRNKVSNVSLRAEF
ncbi:ribosome maturation factor RimP [Clostridium fermenticellae]|uniref:Ribosome maturation factor RimP n=1 Tax=Clostridium fermenticellae TaxID=2068654 RepID=A0A386H2X5_9CLOT|nr:ribosome maturation factor RimP [Clostridium fermenticellae]AYD40067.1 ribosome maturation factor RimP [Clostridium fermenticellae]